MKTTNRIIIIGFGSIGQALLPLLAENFNAEIIIFDKETDRLRLDIAKEFSATLTNKSIDQNNYTEILSPPSRQQQLSFEPGSISVEYSPNRSMPKLRYALFGYMHRALGLRQ